MATAQPVSIVRNERRSLSPRTSPRTSPRASPRTSPRASPRASPRISPRKFTTHGGAHHETFTETSTSSTPYYHSFQESQWLAKLLAELVRKDSEMLNLLRVNRAQHISKVFAQQFQGEDQKQALITSYREFLGSVVSLIAQSVFLENPGMVKGKHDPQGIVKTLCSRRCPDLSIFCRLVVQPAFIASARPDTVCTEMHNGVPVNQLARFCDIAILSFLNGVNEHTKPQAVLWAVDYISNLLHALLYSIGNHSSPGGWYGAPASRQKKTVSVEVPSAFPQVAPPTVVVVGSPPSLDPETGQSQIHGGTASSFQFPPQFMSGQNEPHLSPQLAHSGNASVGGHSDDEGGGRSVSERVSPIDYAISPTWSGSSSSPVPSPQLRGSRGERLPDGTGMLGRDLHVHMPGVRPRSPRLADLRANQPQSIPEEEEEDRREAKPRTMTERNKEGTRTSADPMFGMESSESEAEEEVREKPVSVLQSVDIKTELASLINAEGRISLIAILQAIARLPQSDDIWTEKLGMNCFQLIQLCMDLGLIQSTKREESTSQKRRRFQKQDNVAFRTHGQEQPCQIHSKYIVQYAVHALIQCATNLLVGCSHDSQQTCRLAHKHVLTQNNLIHPRLLRHLNRIHCHSPQEFQRVMMDFAAAAPLRKLLHFLHVVLEYCQPTPHDKVDSLLLSITASVLRTLVDRLTHLDLSKPSLQENILSEVCLFFQYAQTLFNFHTQLDSYRHFHMYIHRIALSVILPEREMNEPAKTNSLFDDPDFHTFPAILEESETLSQPSPGFAVRGSTLSQSLPRKLKHKSASTLSEEKARPRSSVQSNHLVAPKSPKAHRRGLFTKQHSIHERDGGSSVIQGSGSEYMGEWRRLNLNFLRQRIRRLVVLMDMSEPGTVPDSGMLASLIDLSDGTLVVTRAMVLLECALFVHKLRDSPNASHWLRNRQDVNHRALAIHLKRWAIAVGEKLRIVELRERDMIQQLRRKGGGGGKDQLIVLPEEPVLPDNPVEQETRKSGDVGRFRTVSFGIKMCACVLLYEITHYLRDNTHNSLSVLKAPSVNITDLDDRRSSVVSSASTDTDAVATPSPGATGMLHHSLDARFLGALRQPLQQETRSSSLEESVVHNVTNQDSMEDENHQEVPQKRVSVYLRVNSAVEAAEAGTRGRLNSALKQTVNIKSSDAAANKLAPKRRSSISAASVGRRHVSFYDKSRSDRPVVTQGRKSAITVGNLRPIPGKNNMRSSHSFQDNPGASSPSESLTKPTLQLQGSTVSQRSHNIGTQIQNGISRLARRAFRGKQRKTTAGRKKTSVGGSSPNLPQKKRPQRLSQGLVAIEDNKRFFPWLDIVEHLIVVDALNPDAHASHTQTCTELVTALNHVYALQDVGEEGRPRESGCNLNAMFSGALDPLLRRDRSKFGLQQPRSNQSRRTAKMRSSHSASAVLSPSAISSVSSSVSSNQSLASLDFSQIRRGIFSSPSSNLFTAIELFLEQDTALPVAQTDTTFNRARKGFLQQSFAGLLHAPFSLLVYTAPILVSSTFSSLKDIAWETILDRNQQRAEAAGLFFLLAAAKEGETVMKDFFTQNVEKADAAQQRKAVLRFKALWKCRYKVWPAVGEMGQKKFNSEREGEERQDQQTIGYSLPANLLGSAGREVPVAPWKALSLCVHNDCHTNPDKCYRATRLAPLKHCKEVSEAVEDFSVSGVSLSLEADSKPTSVFAGVGSEDNAGNININQWEAVEPTLFPTSLLPLISFVISSLTPHSHHTHYTHHTPTKARIFSSSPQSTNKSELAYQAIKRCMVEDPRLLFRPLLNRFSKLYQEISDKKNRYHQSVFVKSLKDTLNPLHTILQSFPVLPPKAAHFLFNSFVGIITRHTDQPCAFSSEIIQSVLMLLTMVIPSVQGLDLKALKSVLKKESCYTTILTTARIRGVEKINIIDDTFASSTRLTREQSVDADDTFGQVIAQYKNTQLSYDLLQSLYLVDQNKDLPVLSTLVVKDHYSMVSDKQCPTFLLRDTGSGSGREVWSWGHQLNQLFVHKMSEALRVLMSLRLLATGPEVERGSSDIYNKFAQPNYRFLHQELVALTSFPRQALTSVLYEAGPATLTHHHLRSADSMLMGTWVKFVLDLFICARTDYDWGNSLALFLNVINGALLLYSEDLSILRRGLAALIVVASKFVHVFRKHGYEMVVPALVQVYASHMNNKLITDALKFVWGKFYLLNLDSNVFLLQAIAATATLLSEEAAMLSLTSGTQLHSFLHSQQLDPVVVQQHNARAVFQLLESLGSVTAPPDHLHVMSMCPVEQQVDLHWQPLSLQTTFYLCITIASWNPEAVRGMQVLVFLDRLIPMFLNAISLPRSSSFVLESMKLLVKGCDAITKPQSWKGDFLNRRETQRTDTQQNLDVVVPADDGRDHTSQPPLHPQRRAAPERKHSAVTKMYRRIVNPSKSEEVSEGSAYFVQASLDRATSVLPPIGHQEYIGEFKRRLQATNQRVLQLSRISLLSLTSKLVLHEATQLKDRSEPGSRVLVRLDVQTTAYLTTIAVQLLKLGGTNEVTLTAPGLCCFMESLLPNIEWTEAHSGSFLNIISRLVKLFRMLCRVRIILAWESLGIFLKGVTQCIKSSPQLTGHEQIFVKLKMLLEVIVNTPVQGSGGGQEGSPGRDRGGKRRPLLHFAPSTFNDVVVGLVSQLIVTTKDALNPKLRYHISDLLSQKLMKKDTIFPKILLPLCIHLGLREDLVKLPQEDLTFLLQLLDKKVENTLKLGRPPLHPSHFLDPLRSEIPADMFFRAIKIFCCAFSDSFTLHDWSKVAQWVTSLSLRKLEVVHPGQPKPSMIERSGSVSSVLSSGSRSSSRHTSISGQQNFDSYLTFYNALLTHVYESLLSVHHIPLFSFLWPLLRQLEAQFCEAEQTVKSENPGQLRDFRICIEKCQTLAMQLPQTTKSKNNLLMTYQDEMRTPTTQYKFKRASTTVDRGGRRHAKRRLSYQHSLPSIGEEEPKTKPESGSGNVKEKGRKQLDSRPTFLRFSSPPREEVAGKGTAVVMKQEDMKMRPMRTSADEYGKKRSTYVSSSDTTTTTDKPSLSVSNLRPKKSPVRKYVTNPTPDSPLNSPPAEISPRTKRRPRKTPKTVLSNKSSHHPPLSELREDKKFTSSEFQADVEDFDAISPQENVTLDTEGCTMTANEAALQKELESPMLKPHSITVQAEVHFDASKRHKSATPLEKEPSVTSSIAVSPLIPPPPTTSPRTSSRSRSSSPLPSQSHVGHHSPLPSPSSMPPLPPDAASATEQHDLYSQDCDCSSDLLIPRNRTSSSPPLERDDSPLADSSPCDTETDTDTLLPRPSSSASGNYSRKAPSASSPTTQKTLSFERRRGSNASKNSGAFFINLPGLGESSNC